MIKRNDVRPWQASLQNSGNTYVVPSRALTDREDFRNQLRREFSGDTSILNLVNAPQWEYSEDIIECEFSNKISQEKAAEICDISLNSFLEYESGYLNHSIKEYKDILNRLKNSNNVINKN